MTQQYPSDPYGENQYEQGRPAAGGPQGDPKPTIDAAKLWSGAAATAVVAALIAIVGILVARGLLDISVLSPESDGAWSVASIVPYALASAVGALIAGGLAYLLLLSTPRPTLFFGWIMFLVAVVAGVWPFTTGAKLEEQIATAVLDVVLVVAIWSLITGTAERAYDRTGGRRRT